MSPPGLGLGVLAAELRQPESIAHLVLHWLGEGAKIAF
jgi:hypothetical protein